MVMATSCVAHTVQNNYTLPDMPASGYYFNTTLWFVGSALAMKGM